MYCDIPIVYTIGDMKLLIEYSLCYSYANSPHQPIWPKGTEASTSRHFEVFKTA